MENIKTLERPEVTLSKKELDFLKFHISSLFSRKQKFLYIDVDDINTWYFTNIPPAKGYVKDQVGIFIHQNNIDSYYHKVVIKDQTIIDLLVTILPEVQKKSVCIVIADFTALLNKKKFHTVVKKNNKLCYDKNHGSKVVSAPVVGFVDSIMVQHINNIIMDMINLIENSSTVSETIIDKDKIHKSEVCLYPISITIPEGNEYEVKVPLCDGFNIVSRNEYMKRVKDENTFVIRAALDQRTVRVITVFDNPRIHAISGIPASLLFLQKKQ